MIAEEFGFILRASEDGKQQTLLIYNTKSKELRFDRTNSDGWSEGIPSAKLDTFSDSEILNVHIFIDTCVIEVYTDNYRVAMTNNVYPDP